MRRGQATLELVVLLSVVIGIAVGVARLAGRELVRAQAENALARGLEASAARDSRPGEAALAALPVVLRRASSVSVMPATMTLTIDGPAPVGRLRISAPVPELP